MNRTPFRISWQHAQLRFRKVLSTGRAYFVLSLCSMAVFVMLGLAGMLQKSFAVSPVQSMKGFAASVSGRFFESLLGMELPHMTGDPGTSPFQTGKLAAFLVRFLTDLNPNDPKSLLAREMPGMNPDRSVLLRPGSGGGDEAPEDLGPIEEEHGGGQAAPSSGDPGRDPEPESEPAPSEPSASSPRTPSSVQHDTGSDKVVFIYHSHNRESWLPELKPGTKDPNDDKINVTLVGQRLARQLEARGVGASQSSKDYASSVKAYNWNLSYKYSLQTVRQALAGNKNLKYFFDIHRDSQRRGKTTATIRGVDYAQVYFIIGHRNPNWKENEQFASRIHERLEKNYPGLSRGIWGKTAANGNGEYNQSISPDSVLIEIGGIENTLEECYRTADVLAEAIADLYWESQDAEKVDGKAAAGGTGKS
ncbi:stage II sporulation protein P [Cohnella sp. CFH 77786]|uniref:stage II sporulation protein P n=1 Tax=Cohnella sp. CFH 77786 TaxID=2662265 RepID=UPI001C60F12D|nr:stage II sporulation protein P [Cohnella sp. CFH 77786]MBW5444932.1 stage II sporulation protein P [Cohnella sp. CFH 77786]